MRAEADYEERSRVRNQAIECFNANSETLYDAPGRLIIDLTPTGFKFDVDIERSESAGFGQMKVFCYDLMLAQLWSTREADPGFLIHDSTIFADVDERQVAHALQLAARESEAGQFQYICCLNSDSIPENDFEDGFTLDEHVVLTLTDDVDNGFIAGYSLLNFRSCQSVHSRYDQSSRDTVPPSDWSLIR